MSRSFKARVAYAAQSLDRFGRWNENPNSRSFDNCFEMYDGLAVVAALVQMAEDLGGEHIRRGIEKCGSTVWAEWKQKAVSVQSALNGRPLEKYALQLRKDGALRAAGVVLPDLFTMEAPNHA